MMDDERGPQGKGLGYGDVPSSLLLIFPLFLAYELGLLLWPVGNGVDFVSQLVFGLVDHDPQNYLLAHLILGGVYLGFLTLLWTRNALVLNRVLPMLLESAIYALTLGSLILFVMDNLIGLDLLAISDVEQVLASSKIANALMVSMGAGVHEELVFRLGGMGLLGVLLARMGARHGVALIISAVISALLFSAAHHGAAGEAFHISAFIYRFLAGLVFAAIFYFRSLAHAVYSHFFYDFYVSVISQ